VDFSKENLQDRTREDRVDNIPRKKPMSESVLTTVRIDNSSSRFVKRKPRRKRNGRPHGIASTWIFSGPRETTAVY
jgi:hypothetical protein